MLIEECNAGRFNSQSTSNAWWAVSKLVPSTHALFSPLLHALETALLGCLASSASEAERPNSQVGMLGGNGVRGWAVTRWQLLHQPAWRTAAPGLHLHTGPQPLLLHHDFPPTFLLDPSHTFPFVLPLPPPSWQAVSSIFYAWGRLDGYLPGGTVLQLMWGRTLHLALTFDTQGGHSLVIAGAGQAAGVRGLPPPPSLRATRGMPLQWHSCTSLGHLAFAWNMIYCLHPPCRAGVANILWSLGMIKKKYGWVTLQLWWTLHAPHPTLLCVCLA